MTHEEAEQQGFDDGYAGIWRTTLPRHLGDYMRGMWTGEAARWVRRQIMAAKLPTKRVLFPYVRTDTTGPDTVPIGTTRFEQARQRLAAIAVIEVEEVRDLDVREYLALGELAARQFLENQARRNP